MVELARRVAPCLAIHGSTQVGQGRGSRAPPSGPAGHQTFAVWHGSLPCVTLTPGPPCLQMSITSPEGAEFARARGVGRVVVGRELSVREISLTAAGTAAEVEAFVHGALW